MTFQFNRVRQSFHEADSLTGKQRISEDYLRSLVRLGLRNLSRERYGLVFARIADLLGMTPGGVKDALKKIAQQQPQAPRRSTPQTKTQTVSPAPQANTDAPPVYDPGLEVQEESHEELDFGQPPTPDHGPPADLGPRDAQQRAERHIIGCLMNKPELFDEHTPDGHAICESVLSEEFTDPFAAEIYHAISDWLWEHHDMQAADLRDVFSSEAHLQGALEMQLNVDRLTDSEDEQLLDLLVKCATYLHQRHAELQYRQQKTETATEPSAGEKLLLAVNHNRNTKSAGRMPRPIGS
jgi:hypothetical protein